MESDSAGGHHWIRRSIFSHRTKRVRCIFGQKICVERRAFEAFCKLQTSGECRKHLSFDRCCEKFAWSVKKPCPGPWDALDEPPRGRRTTKLGSWQQKSSRIKSREPLRSVQTLPFICGWSKLYADRLWLRRTRAERWIRERKSPTKRRSHDRPREDHINKLTKWNPLKLSPSSDSFREMEEMHNRLSSLLGTSRSCLVQREMEKLGFAVS